METPSRQGYPQSERAVGEVFGGDRWLLAGFGFCVLFGVLLVALTDPVGDGSWFWYAAMFRGGQRLYADMHLALQPMLPLEFSFFQGIFGTRWLPFQLLGICNAVVYATGLALVVRQVPWKGWQRALLLACSFVVTTDFLTFRFDDYHVLSACLAVYSIVCLLMVHRSGSPHERILLLAILGALSGACITNRLNDGAALCASVLFIVVVGERSRRLWSGLVVAVAAVLTGTAVVLVTGDSLRAWWRYSIAGAAAIKGGTGSVVRYPLLLPGFTVRLLLISPARVTGAAVWSVAVFTMLALAARYSRRRDGGLRWGWIAGGAALLALTVSVQRSGFLGPAQTHPIVELLVLAMFLLVARALLRQLGRHATAEAEARRRELLLLLIPMGQLLSIAMSSGHWYPNAFPPVAVFLLVAPIALGRQLNRVGVKAIFLSVVTVLLVTAFREKMDEPFAWWSYRAGSVMSPRTWYRHPVYGPMLIEKSHLTFIEPVCGAVASQSEGEEGLLSLPFPYANYFCAIPPWHGYVQTFFDTSSKQTIDTLMGELQQRPPQWIFYQRQLDVLRAHELALNGGRPLPHRALDTMIAAKVESGEWRVALQEQPENDTSTWYLIRTR